MRTARTAISWWPKEQQSLLLFHKVDNLLNHLHSDWIFAVEMRRSPWFVVRDPSLDAIAKPPEAQLSVLHETLGGDRALPSTVLCLQLEREIPVI